MEPKPPASLTAPGICHNLPLVGHPSAREVTLNSGTPTGHLVVGYFQTGQAVVVDSPSGIYLDELEAAIHTERARLALWYPPQVHPFGDVEGPEAA